MNLFSPYPSVATVADMRQYVAKFDALAETVRKAPLPPKISIHHAEALVLKATQAYQQFVKRGTEIVSSSSSAGVRDSMRSAVAAVTRSYESKILGRLAPIVNEAKRSGKKEVDPYLFPPNVGLMLNDIAGGYAALAEIESYKPWFVQLMPGKMLEIFVSIAEVVESAIKIAGGIYDSITNAIDAAGRGVSATFEALKWGTIAGGLYLLYRLIEPKKKGT